MNDLIEDSRLWVVLVCWDGGEDVEIYSTKEKADNARLRHVLEFVATVGIDESCFSTQVLSLIADGDAGNEVVQNALGDYGFSCSVMPRVVRA